MPPGWLTVPAVSGVPSPQSMTVVKSAIVEVGSASVNGNQLTLTVTNPSIEQTREAEVVVRGGSVQSAAGVMLAEKDVHAHNSFEAPREVEPKAVAVSVKPAGTVFSFPPASVTRITFGLG